MYGIHFQVSCSTQTDITYDGLENINTLTVKVWYDLNKHSQTYKHTHTQVHTNAFNKTRVSLICEYFHCVIYIHFMYGFKILFSCELFQSTLEPCYNEDCKTMKITLYQVSLYIRDKINKYEELGPAKLPCYIKEGSGI